MTGFCTLVIFMAAVVMFAGTSDPLDAQTDLSSSQLASATSKSATVSLSIAVPKEQIPVGQKPWVFLSVKNLSDVEIAFPMDRVHVEGETGEPPTTLYQRQVTHKLRPGEPELRSGGFEPIIEPGDSSTRKYDLSGFYDLSKPGKYTVYIEVLDESASKNNAVWVRSPIATFEMQPPTR